MPPYEQVPRSLLIIGRGQDITWPDRGSNNSVTRYRRGDQFAVDSPAVIGG